VNIWIKGSSRITRYLHILVNIKTSRRLFIGVDDVFDTGHELLIRHGNNYVYFYDANYFNIIDYCSCPIFVTFNKELQILITENFDFYRIGIDYKLRRVKFGYNYYADRAETTNWIMEIILYDTDLLFSLIPNDISYFEMYQQIVLIYCY